MAEALLRDRLRTRGVDASVSSAGIATEDLPPTDEVLELLRGAGLDASAHRSRIIDKHLVDRADLIIGMARMHVREVALFAPPKFPVTFTLKELVRLGGEAGPRPRDVGLDAWLRDLGRSRSPAAHLALPDDDDVEDPMGRRFGVYKKVAAEITELVDRLVDLAWPANDPGADPADAG
jgi:protein-tyrosine phosphatase